MADNDQSAGQRALHPALIGGIVLALALLAFVAQNTDDVKVHFLFFDSTKPLWLLLLLTSALAIGASEVFGWVLRRRNK